ncbi:MAG: helix-hairpin-helix domain-containing protein, partial [Candidatus Rokubacteria bacterium]|nr:helix-hairpin-helix domain-containing protein [Candidatus Rokubacteria bacterium]
SPETMGTRQWRRRLLRRVAREAHRAAEALRAVGQRLAYRPREVVVVALLAAGLFGGLAVQRWRARHPATVDRLEAEPVRLTTPAPVQSVPRFRSRSVTARCEEPGTRGRRFGSVSAGPASPRLDLNRATPGELARVAGISWRLAARIVAAREAFEGREYRRTEPDGVGAPSVETPPAPDTRDADTPEGPADAEPQ